jgi:hypothetical protein
MPRRAVALLALLALAGCAGGISGISGIRLPGGPSRGSMTYDEAMGARSGLTTLDRVPTEEPGRH